MGNDKTIPRNDAEEMRLLERIADLGAERDDLRTANRQLVDLIGNLAEENIRLRAGFLHVLSLADDARLAAQRERDAVLERQEIGMGRAA